MIRIHRRVRYVVRELSAVKGVKAVHFQCLGLECTHASSNEHGLSKKLHTVVSAYQKTAIVLTSNLGNNLPEMKMRPHGRNLLHQVLGELATSAHGHRRNVIDRFVGIQLYALPTRVGQSIDDVGLDFKQPQLKNLKQPRRPRAHNERVDFQRGVLRHTKVRGLTDQLR